MSLPGRQTIIPLSLDASTVFDNFYQAGNESIVLQLRRLLADDSKTSSLYLWGERGCGKTHLLHASCHSCSELGGSFHYVSFTQPDPLPEPCHIDSSALLCLDDVDRIAGSIDWQQSVLACYEHVINSGGKVVMAADSPPPSLGLQLKDLVSRMTAGGVYRISTLSDNDKIEALRMRAHRRGFKLDESVGQYILRHYKRDASSLFSLLDRLDKESLVEQRKVTIPFIKCYLSGR